MHGFWPDSARATSPAAERPRRRRRADAGKFRIHPDIRAKLCELFATPGRLRMVDVQRELRVFCKLSRLRMPSRAALYRARRLLPLAGHRVSDLPVEVQESLYNLAPDALVSGEQLVFYAFNYGTTAAMSFAASLPVVCLERAALRGGWRPKSLSLLESVLRTRRG